MRIKLVALVVCSILCLSLAALFEPPVLGSATLSLESGVSMQLAEKAGNLELQGWSAPRPFQRGDLLFGCRTKLFTGVWTHVGMYIGNGLVVHSHSRLGPDGLSGVDIVTLEWWMETYVTWAAYRVVTASPEVVDRAIEWATADERLDDPYDWCWFRKDANGDAWYCSELVWAAYLHGSDESIDIEDDPDCFGVLPDEITRDDDIQKMETLFCDSEGSSRERFTAGESVFVKATGLEPNTTYAIWIQDDPVASGDMLVPAEDPSGQQELVTTDESGAFAPVHIWAIPPDSDISYHAYHVVVDKQDDGENTGKCSSASDGIDSAAAVGVCPRWDVNQDGKVDYKDMNIVSKHYGEKTASPYPVWDINQDGKVDYKDMSVISEHYGESCP